jgi:hypothetical protein
MSVCSFALLVKLSESWPKFKFFDVHKILKNGGQKKVPRLTKIHVYWQLGWIYFRHRKTNRALLVAAF